MTEELKPYLSVSQMESFSRCPEAYRRRYLEKQKLPPAVAMLRGSALHKGAEVNFRQKIDSHVDLPISDIIDAAAANFEEKSQDEVMLDPDEQARGKDVVIGEALDSVVTMAECHAREQAPSYQPVYVEEQIEIELPSSRVNLLGVLDLADDIGRVVDIKTAGKKKSQADADDSLQLTVYASCYHAMTGEKPTDLRLDTVVETKTKVYRDVTSTKRVEDDYRSLAHRVNAISGAIDSGVFTPTSPGNWWCSAKWCGYWSTCPFVQGNVARQND